MAFVHPAQHLVAAGLQPHIHHGQALRPQQAQVLLAFDLETGGRGVARHPLALREQTVDQAQNLAQFLRFPHQGVAVRQKDPLHLFIDPAGHLEVLPDLLHGSDGEVLVVVHIAKGAAVVAASVGHLHDEAVSLTGRTVYLSLITHGLTLLWSFPPL